MGDQAGGPRAPRSPSQPVSRPPRLRPSPAPRRAGAAGRGLRTLGGALLAVAAVSLGIAVLLALRGGGGDALLAVGQGDARRNGVAEPGPEPESMPDRTPSPAPAVPASPSPSPAPAPAPTAPPVPADVTVTVLGVGGTDAAEATARQLRTAGWQVRLVARYRGDPPGTTTLFQVPGREDAAALLAAQAGATAVRAAPANLSDSDLTLVLGEQG